MSETKSLLDKLPEADQILVAEHLGQYYNWHTGNGGKHPDEILKYPHTIEQRKALLECMDNINIILGYLKPVIDKRRGGQNPNDRPYRPSEEP